MPTIDLRILLIAAALLSGGRAGQDISNPSLDVTVDVAERELVESNGDRISPK